jgi:2-oxoglutarate ferredoxin oxidoreductase subunit alpha
LKQIQKNIPNQVTKIFQGNEACVEGALAAGCKFFAGYPITPASEIAELMASKLPLSDGVFMQMEDELASINAIIGARWGGARSMTATSGAGYSLMQEGLGYALVTETPIVIVEVQRGGPSTGQPTMSSQADVYQARYGSHGDYELIVYAPSSVQEMFDFTIKAFSKSEQFRVPVIVLADEIVAHMREKVQISPANEIYNRQSPTQKCECPFKADDKGIPPTVDFFQGHSVLVDGQLHDERGIRAGHDPIISGNLVKRLNTKITGNIDDITDIETFFMSDADTVVVAYGSVARSGLSAVKQARQKGINAGFVKVNTIWPFPEKALKNPRCANGRTENILHACFRRSYP